MKIEPQNTKTVITTKTGEITEIFVPEELDRNLSDYIHLDFNHNQEHYYAVAINHSNQEILNNIVEIFKMKV